MPVIITIICVVVIMGFVIVIHELGHFITARLAGIKVEEFGLGYPPRLFGIKRGETVYSLNIIPLGGFCKMLGEEDPSDPRSFASKKASWRLLVLGAGSFVMFLAPFIVFPIANMIPHNVVVDGEGVAILAVEVNSPAHKAGIRINDEILYIDDIKVNSAEELGDIVKPKVGTEVSLTLARDSEIKTVSLVPRIEYPSNSGPMGVSLGWARVITEKKAYWPWEAIPRGFEDGWMMYILIWDGVKTLFSGAQPFMVTGIVGITQATGEIIKTGFMSIVGWTCLLSINLAIINLLPIPALDGGRMVFVILEIIRGGKRISPRTEGLIHMIGFALLIGFMIIVTYYDIMRIASGKSLF